MGYEHGTGEAFAQDTVSDFLNQNWNGGIFSFSNARFIDLPLRYFVAKEAFMGLCDCTDDAMDWRRVFVRIALRIRI